MKKIKELIVAVYHMMQQHYLTFRVLVWMKEHGITRRANVWVLHSDEPEAARQQAKQMQRSKEFFEANKERAERMLSLLADEKSKTVWGG